MNTNTWQRLESVIQNLRRSICSIKCIITISFLYTTMNDRQQENYIESADEETLIFIFCEFRKIHH